MFLTSRLESESRKDAVLWYGLTQQAKTSGSSAQRECLSQDRAPEGPLGRAAQVSRASVKGGPEEGSSFWEAQRPLPPGKLPSAQGLRMASQDAARPLHRACAFTAHELVGLLQETVSSLKARLTLISLSRKESSM